MDGWKIVYVSTLPQDIYLAQGYLESDGISTMLRDELTVQVYNFYSQALGGVKLLVPDGKFVRASGLLSASGYIVSPAAFPAPLETIRSADRSHCPWCGSTEIRKKKEPDWAMLVVYFLPGGLFPIFKPVYICCDCPRAWRFKR